MLWFEVGCDCCNGNGSISCCDCSCVGITGFSSGRSRSGGSSGRVLIAVVVLVVVLVEGVLEVVFVVSGGGSGS